MTDPADISAPPPPEHADSKSAGFSLLRECGRKSFHLATGIIPLAVWWLGRETAAMLLVPAAAALLIFEIARTFSDPLNTLFVWIFRPLLRESEMRHERGKLALTGSTWMLLSYSLLVLYFPIGIAVPAMLIVTVADPAAAIVGKAVGRRKPGANGKTLEGTAAFFVAGALVAVVGPALAVPIWAIVLGAFVAAAVEAVLDRLDDNFVVPLVAALVMAWAIGVPIGA